MTTSDPTPVRARRGGTRTRPVAERVELLLREMTLEEKVAQLGSRWVGNDMQPTEPGRRPRADLNVAPMQDVFAAGAATPLAEASRHGLGHLTRVYGSRPLSPAEGAAELVRQQRTVIDGSRLGIPAIVHEECLTGFTAYGATVYPAAIAWGAAFDPDLVERMAAAIGRDMAAVGVHQGLSPVVDVVRDYRWGRVEETIGEDPYLVATTACAYVRGLQSAGVIATLKHFAGYSASRAARNHGPVSMGRRELMDVVLPPFEAAVTLAGVRFGDALLRRRRRRACGRSTDGCSPRCCGTGGASRAPSCPTTGRCRSSPPCTGWPPTRRTRARWRWPRASTSSCRTPSGSPGWPGGCPRRLIDRAVRRLLTQKVELGLLDPDWTPEGSVAVAAAVDLDAPANRALARALAERSIVLLDRGSALPLRDGLRRVAVVGPCADDARTFMGCYAFATHVLPRFPGYGLGIDAPTAVDALRAELPDAEVVYAPGCAVQRHRPVRVRGRRRRGPGCRGVRRARRRPRGPVRPRHVRRGLRRGGPAAARRAGRAARRAARHRHPGGRGGRVRPAVRPRRRPRPRRPALVQAFMPGEEGGGAIAGVLSGRVQPVGRLPVQIPRGPGGQPSTYLQPPLGGAESAGISSLDATPLFPFGHGRSYTTFVVDDLRLSGDELPTDGEITVTVRVRNTGDRAGEEVVQLYLRDVLAQVVRPTRQLVGFARVPLDPGAAADVRFRLHADRTAFTGPDLRRIVEPGDVEVLVGTSADDLPCRGKVRLTGPLREVGADRQLVTPVDVSMRADA